MNDYSCLSHLAHFTIVSVYEYSIYNIISNLKDYDVGHLDGRWC